MHKISYVFGLIAAIGMSGVAHGNTVLARDTSDPLFMIGTQNILSQTNLTYWDDVLRIGQTLGYGFNERFSVSANMHYQHDFSGDEDGFSSVDLGGVYRLTTAAESEMHMVSDVLFGAKIGGSSHVRTPWFADSTYYAGLRFGRQWGGMTLAATIKSSWIFDSDRGMAYLDFIPESYFRVAPDWRLGAGLDFRKATNPHYDQEWINLKAVRQYGRTQYIANFGYEFESDDVQIGAQVNILF